MFLKKVAKQAIGVDKKMVKILFFAQLREVLNCDQIQLDNDLSTVGEIREILCEKGEIWKNHLATKHTLCAVNKTLCDDNHPVTQGDEIAFFPPVTGG